MEKEDMVEGGRSWREGSRSDDRDKFKQSKKAVNCNMQSHVIE
jgi:hypothetical protein